MGPRKEAPNICDGVQLSEPRWRMGTTLRLPTRSIPSTERARATPSPDWPENAAQCCAEPIEDSTCRVEPRSLEESLYLQDCSRRTGLYPIRSSTLPICSRTAVAP